MKHSILNFLKNRGYIYQSSDFDKIEELLENKTAFYVGFDPTADSLHVGHLMTMMVMKYMQNNGNIPYFVIGGGTGVIGDPSGRLEMRKLLSLQDINKNCEALKKQMQKFVTFEGKNQAMFVNNADWLLKINWAEFLRDYGIYFSVNKMLTAEAFKTRLNSEFGLSFLEFNYMLMQAYDFYYLFKNHNVKIQMGGSDQWSNILAGVDLIRRKLNQSAYALTFNLLLKHDGNKMGKTASGTIWLDANKTTPYDFYQYWLNIDDLDVEKMLMLLTDIKTNEIKKLCAVKGKAMIEAKKQLAASITKTVHGEKELQKAIAYSKSAFENKDQNLPKIFINKNDLKTDDTIVNILFLTKLAPSKSEARRLVLSGGVLIDQIKINDVKTTLKELKVNSNKFTLHKGKKNHILVVVK